MADSREQTAMNELREWTLYFAKMAWMGLTGGSLLVIGRSIHDAVEILRAWPK